MAKFRHLGQIFEVFGNFEGFIWPNFEATLGIIFLWPLGIFSLFQWAK